MKKSNYHITRQNIRTVEIFKDAEGNIIIPAQYLIKESDTNKQKLKKNRMWLAWQKRRNIKPVTDLPNYKRIRTCERRGNQYMSIYKEQRQRYREEQCEKIAKIEQRIAELQKQRETESGARYDELTTQINILRCKIIQTKYPVCQCDTENPKFYNDTKNAFF